MSNVLGVVVPSKYDSESMVSFIAANGTAAKILIDKKPAVAGTTSAPQFYGGGSVFDVLASSSDSADKDVKLYAGVIKTTQDAINTGTLTTTVSSLARSSGSWLADGFSVGDQIMIFAPYGTAPNAAIDGILCTVIAVSATTLTFNGTPLAALALAALSRVVKVSLLNTVKVPLNSGSTNALPSISLLTTNTGTIVTNERKFGANDLIIAAPTAAVSALPCAINISAQTASY